MEIERFHNRRFLQDLRAAVAGALDDDSLSPQRKAVLVDRISLYDLLLADGGPGDDAGYEDLLMQVLDGRATRELLEFTNQWAMLREARRLLTFMRRQVTGEIGGRLG
ncbi:MAG: hypothetical protein HW416_2701 [Chloroflexi bacterium]|nr:hypothetical protein [Chloroflexota bacterium]